MQLPMPVLFLREVLLEIKKVSWPSARLTIMTSFLVSFFMIFFSFFFMFSDRLINYVINFLIAL